MKTKELFESIDDHRKEEMFMLRMMHKLLKKNGYRVAELDDTSVDVLAHGKMAMIFYNSENSTWTISLIFDDWRHPAKRSKTKKLRTKHYANSPEKVLQILQTVEMKDEDV